MFICLHGTSLSPIIVYSDDSLMLRLTPSLKPQAVPHGNSKSDIVFHPTWPSTMTKMQIDDLKDTLNNVSSSSSGMMKACRIGQLPHNEHQISNMYIAIAN